MSSAADTAVVVARYLKPKQVAAELAVNSSTVSEWIRRGELPATLVSAQRRSNRPQYRILRQDLEAFEAARRLQPRGRAAPPPRRGAYERIVGPGSRE